MSKLAIRVHMDDALVAEVDAEADREDRSRNWTINDLVRRGLIAKAAEEGLAFPSGAIERDPEFQREVDQRIQQAAIKPTLDKRRAEKQRSPRAVPPPPGPEGVDGGPAHRHRYTDEVEGSRQGRAGIIQADFACSCGLTRRQPVKN